jgi:hypothetical protein
MISVRVALIRRSRVRVNISDYGETTLLAYVPKAPEIAPVKTNDAGAKAVGIEIVVKNKIDDLSQPILATAKEKCTALPCILAATLPQSNRQSPPDPYRTSQLTLRRKQALCNRGFEEVHAQAPSIEEFRLRGARFLTAFLRANWGAQRCSPGHMASRVRCRSSNLVETPLLRGQRHPAAIGQRQVRHYDRYPMAQQLAVSEGIRRN